jgi:hypothetical protein
VNLRRLLLLPLLLLLLLQVHRQWRQIRVHAQDVSEAYTKSLMDAI